MKTKLYLLALAVILAVNSFAQSQLHIFENWSTDKGIQNFPYKNITKTDAIGNVYVAGATFNYANNNYDMFLQKYNHSGGIIWTQTFGGSDLDFATSLFVDNNGNAYVTGLTTNTTPDIITIKYDSTGAEQWHQSYDRYTYDCGGDIIVDDSDYVYVVGGTYNAFMNSDMVLLKYSSSGTLKFSDIWDNPTYHLNDAANKITFDSGNKYAIIAGVTQRLSNTYHYATVSYNKDDGSYYATYISSTFNTNTIDEVKDLKTDSTGIYMAGRVAVSGQYDMCLVKLDTLLNVIFTSTYGGSDSLDDEANGLALDNSGNIYLTGYTSTSSQGKNYTTLKYNSSGTLQWHKEFNDSLNSDDEATAIAIDDSANVYVTGSAKITTINNLDYYTIKYNASGTEQWNIASDGKNHLDDTPSNIVLDNLGNIIVAGQSSIDGTKFDYKTVQYTEKQIVSPTDYYGETPANSFEYYENRGQLISTDTTNPAIPDVRYYTNNSSPALYFQDKSLSFVFASIDTSTSTTDTLHRIDQIFVNASGVAKIYPMDKQADYLNYFLPQCPDGITEIHGNQKLVISNLYDNIDLMYSSNGAGLKCYYIVKPYADPRDIKILFDGVSSTAINGSTKELEINSSIGSISFQRPKAYQLDGSNSIITLTDSIADWTSIGTDSYDFDIGTYDNTKVLVIEVDRGRGPTNTNLIGNLDWSTFYGGQAYDDFYDIDVYKNNGSIYVTGYTQSTSFPVTTNAFQAQITGGRDAFALKFLSNGFRSYATYYGTSTLNGGNQLVYSGAINSQGNYFICGVTVNGSIIHNIPFPLVQPPNAYVDTSFNGGTSDGFIVEFNTTGTQLIWATYYGTSANESVSNISIDSLDNVYVSITNQEFGELQQKAGAYFDSINGTYTLVKFRSDLHRDWATLFGGTYGAIHNLNVDDNNNLYVIGMTSSSIFPIVRPGNQAYVDSTLNGGLDAFVSEFDSNGALVWSTFLGGSANEDPYSVCITNGNSGEIIVTGITSSPNFPYLYAGGLSYIDSTLSNSSQDGFIVSFKKQNKNQTWGTYYGGSNSEFFNSITYDASTNIYIGGHTTSSDFQTQDFFGYYNDSTFDLSTNSDAVLVSFNSDKGLQWATYFAGTKDENIEASAYSAINDKLYITGYTTSLYSGGGPNNFPLQYYGPQAYWQPDLNLNNSTVFDDGFISRFSLTPLITSVHNSTSNNQEFVIYPNPTSNLINIKYSNINNDNIKVNIYNILGELVKSDDLGKQTNVFHLLDLSKYNNGMYFIQLQAGNKMLYSKIIKQ